MDLHGPLPVATREGYCYWMTFIDDATSHCAAIYVLNKKATHLELSKPTRHLLESSKDFVGADCVEVAFTGNRAHWS